MNQSSSLEFYVVSVGYKATDVPRSTAYLRTTHMFPVRVTLRFEDIPLSPRFEHLIVSYGDTWNCEYTPTNLHIEQTKNAIRDNMWLQWISKWWLVDGFHAKVGKLHSGRWTPFTWGYISQIFINFKLKVTTCIYVYKILIFTKK